MVEVGLAVTLAPVVADKPVAGDHVYDVAVPLAVRPVEVPLQIATPEPALTVGNEFTVIVTLAVLLHVPLLPVTV
jgi:hypothetical protein